MESAERFIKKIKDQEIKPKPKWKFTYRNMITWMIMLCSVLAGALAFSIILFAIQQIEFNLIAHMSHSRFEWWLGMLPFIWIISLLVFVGVSAIGLKYTRRGYKYSIKALIIINITFSILIGSLFFIGGGAQWLENVFASNLRAYESVHAKKVKMWSVPDEGYLSGYILEVNDSDMLIIDFDDKKWTIDLRDAFISQMVELEHKELIKLIGDKTAMDQFHADEVRPWGGFGKKGNGEARNRNQ